MAAVTEMSLVGRVRDAWTAAHAAVDRVPSWARLAVHAIPYTVLPSSLWRIAVVTFHAPIANGPIAARDTPSGLPGVPSALYVILLSVVSELAAFTAVGLVARWGEIFPRWLPVVRGRRVQPLLAVVPAALGTAVLTVLWTWVAVSFALGRRIDGSPLTSSMPLGFHDWQGVVAVVAYAPLLLWGPLLGAVTVAYARRRERRQQHG